MELKKILDDAKEIDGLVQSVWEKYDGSEGEDMPRDDNWMLEYAILNRGHDFFNYFVALNEFQKELETHEGEFCYSQNQFSSAAPKLKDNGIGSFKIDFSSSFSTYKNIFFQLRFPGLVPGKIRRVHNSTLDRKDYSVELAVAAEKSFLINDDAFNGFHVYVDGSKESHVIYGSHKIPAIHNVWQDSPLVWKMKAGNIMVGDNIKIVIGNEAVLKETDSNFVIKHYDPEKQTPLEYIQAMRDKERKNYHLF
ncbi:hypothetical protein HON71_03200 [Candidatus Woesearchaeota archaeon]|jgi:hypothetical protein|nr:hypothetical protein [Candidatus Woesearchaeota archaeon]MBT5342409.1 hypothetical protein [Candidatus Woesearchaeota archaeon]